MARSKKSQLSRYVARIMKQKGLKQRDIESRSGGEITDGYVSNILSGAADNPSAQKMKALARGLGVDPRALFEAACGPFELPAAGRSSENRPDVSSILEMIQEVAQSRESMMIVQESLKLEPRDRAVVLESLESLNQRRGKKRAQKKSPRVTK